jgi:hypothetical protein
MQERELDPQEPGIDPEADERRALAFAQWQRATTSATWWRRRPVRVLAAVGVVGVAAGVWFATRPAPQVHVRGTLALASPGFLSSYNGCEGTGGYDDITAGVAVTVGGANGQVLGIGALGPGQAGVACTFNFDVAVPAGQSLYTVTISHRGTETFTPAQIGDIQLTLGQ